jgi:hypothetical protein
MMEITWKIDQMDRNVESGLVTTVYWRVIASTVVDAVSVDGTVTLERGEEFVEFDDLSKEVVIQWVKQKLGTEKIEYIEKTLSDQISSLIEAKTVSGLPASWVVVEDNE